MEQEGQSHSWDRAPQASSCWEPGQAARGARVRWPRRLTLKERRGGHDRSLVDGNLRTPAHAVDRQPGLTTNSGGGGGAQRNNGER